jgi:hypothetical protein
MSEMGKKGPGLTLKDWLGFLFSVAALAISAASYYANNYRVENNTLARITDVTIDAVAPDDPIHGYRNGNIVLKVAFFNAGNRPAIITGATYQLSDLPNLENGGFGNEVLVDPGTFPFLVAARDLRLVSLKIPVRVVVESFDHGARIPQPTNDPSQELRRFFAGLRYEAIDSAGMMHLTWSGMEISIEVSKTGWRRLGPVNPKKQFSLTPLLQ